MIMPLRTPMVLRVLLCHTCVFVTRVCCYSGPAGRARAGAAHAVGHGGGGRGTPLARAATGDVGGATTAGVSTVPPQMPSVCQDDALVTVFSSPTSMWRLRAGGGQMGELLLCHQPSVNVLYCPKCMVAVRSVA